MNLPKMSPAAESVLAAATRASGKLRHHFVGVEHFFLGLVEEGSLDLGRAFASVDYELERFVEILRKRIEPAPLMPKTGPVTLTPRCHKVLELAAKIASSQGTLLEPRHLMEATLRERRNVPVRLMHALEIDVSALHEALKFEPEPEPTPTPLLERFGRDLTALARRGSLGPVVGREPEMELLAQVLLRKNKNNPVLVGEAGVGKTAVVEGLARRLVDPSCPEPLRDRRLIELNMGALVAGTKFRGEFEERLLGLVTEVAQHPEVILFLDEVHTLVGAGSTGGGDAMDASNILKPALARGELRCIGATTIEEYRRHIEPDPALDRRFETVLVDEPSSKEALAILVHLRSSLEEHHSAEVLPEALEAAVELTVKHVFDRRLPDKALDAIDQTCARRRLQRYAEGGPGDHGLVRVTAEDVATTVSQWTGIPLERISGEAAVALLNIEDELLGRVIGQDDAVRAVSRTVLTAKAGLADPDRPLGVFLFTGPTGVGKTHLAKSLAEVLFGDAKRLVRIDMSEYAEAHSVSNLIGAPRGYVGHEREGVLISALRTHPHCIVLFDELEKAHPKVFDLFLQLFDEGRLTGTHGKTADFTQAVVILTSNLDVTPLPTGGLGFSGATEESAAEEPPELSGDATRQALVDYLRPELVNRIDAVVPFGRLAAPALRRIVDGYVRAIEALVADRGVRLDLSPEVYDHLLARADADRFGARELQRLVDLELRQPLAEEIVRRGGENVGTVSIAVRDGAIVFETAGDGPQNETGEEVDDTIPTPPRQSVERS